MEGGHTLNFQQEAQELVSDATSEIALGQSLEMKKWEWAIPDGALLLLFSTVGYHAWGQPHFYLVVAWGLGILLVLPFVGQFLRRRFARENRH